MIRKASTAAQFRPTHGGGYGEERNFWLGQGGDGDLIGRFEVDLVVVDIAPLGEQRRDTFRRIVRAAAADTDESLGLCLPGHTYPFFKGGHRRMRGNSSKQTNAACSERLLDASNSIRAAHDVGTTDDQGSVHTQTVQRATEVRNGVRITHNLLRHASVAELQHMGEFHSGRPSVSSSRGWHGCASHAPPVPLSLPGGYHSPQCSTRGQHDSLWTPRQKCANNACPLSG